MFLRFFPTQALDPNTSAAVSAMIKGEDVDPSQPSDQDDEPTETEDPLAAFRDGQESQTEGDSTDSQVSKPADKKDEQVEYLEVTGENGRTKIKVDWNNKEAIKNAIKLSVGARKWQAERDQLQSKYKEVMAEYEDTKNSWAAVESAYKSQGVQGLVDLFAGKEGAYSDWLQKQVERELLKRDASPAELERLELQEKLERLESQNKKVTTEAQKRQEELQRQQEAVQRERLESSIHPAFEKYRFAGELGDAALEARLDKAIWTDAMDALAEIEESQGAQAITPQVASRVFKEVAESIKKAVQVQSKKEAAAASEQRKVAAQTKVAQKTQTVAQSKQSGHEEFKEALNKGSFTDMFKLVASGRVKL